MMVHDDYSVFGRPHTRVQKFWYWFDHFSWTTAFFVSSTAFVLWLWRLAAHAPVPRLHPQVAALKVECVHDEMIELAVRLRMMPMPEGQSYRTLEDIRASAERTVKVRDVLALAEVLQLEAQMLADIADHIEAAGNCVPYRCQEVLGRIGLLRNARTQAAETNAVLHGVLALPPGTQVALEGDLGRLRNGWGDSFTDAFFHVATLLDLQQVHAGMVQDYPNREPLVAAVQVLLGKRR
ncbi:MAG: hypothetical protein GAK31_02095 [Stenotrophomonas maltophilia]|uniref:Transmembrane protein n=1 Tax=Stenotrophomonas maltophilia TaxID=40324 RepID=A0A7V8FFK0_STEMA|nr:MAG: hypothetical protein GAK31_02095 [Stenotrophomonas maltophilia]